MVLVFTTFVSRRDYLTIGIVLLLLSLSLFGCTNNLQREESYMVEGQVIDDTGKGIPGVLLLVSGDTTATLTTDDGGYYMAEVRGQVLIEAIKEGYSFHPSVIIVETSGEEYNFKALSPTEYQLLIEVREMEFGQLVLHQLKVHNHKSLDIEKMVLRTSSRLEGSVRSIEESLYGVNLEGDVRLVLLDNEQQIIGEAVIPLGTYKKYIPFLFTREGSKIEDTSLSLIEIQSPIGAHLAYGILSYDTDKEGEIIEEFVPLHLADDRETNLDMNYFVMNNIAVEFDFAFEESDSFHYLFTEKFKEVDYNFEDLNLHIHLENTLTNAKTGEEVRGEAKEGIKNSITRIYNHTYRTGRRRATAHITYSFQRDVGSITVFTLTVHGVTGLYGAKGFTLLHPEESIGDFGVSMMRSTDEDSIFYYILGEESPYFAGGIGTEEYPYLIATPEHLQSMRMYLEPGTYFQLTADIDMKEYRDELHLSSLQRESLWEPVGSYYKPFEGNFDGSGYTIYNLELVYPERVNIGLFGYVGSKATLQRVVLENVNIVGQRQVGALAGRNRGSVIQCEVKNGVVQGIESVGGLLGVNNEGGRIENSFTLVDVIGEDLVGGLVGANANEARILHSSAEGSVTGGRAVGGLVGSNETFSLIGESSASGYVSGTGEGVGGLVGVNYGSEIERSHARGDVYGEDLYIGGLVGRSTGSSSIYSSWAMGDVRGEDNTVGGLVGMNWEGLIEESYASGDVIGVTNIGGLVGVNWEEGTIKKSYATGSVTGSGDRVGGLAGRNDYRIEDSYYVGGSVSGRKYVGLFVGVNWDTGEIYKSYARGDVRGDVYGFFYGHNQNDAFTILPFQIDEYFGSHGSAVAKDSVATEILLDRAPSQNVVLVIAPEGTSRMDLYEGDGGETISTLRGDGKRVRVEVPKETREDYKIILFDDYENRIESSATLTVQNVDDVLEYDEDRVDYRSARFGHRFMLDMAPVEGVTAWLAPADTNRHGLNEAKDTMTRLIGSKGRRSMDSPHRIGLDYRIFLVDMYNNFVESTQDVVIGKIGNEDQKNYFITLWNAIYHHETVSGDMIKFYADYRLKGLDGEGSYPTGDQYPADPVFFNEDELIIHRGLDFDLNRNTLTLGGGTIVIKGHGTTIRNGKVDDAAKIEVDGARDVLVELIDFSERVDIKVESDITFKGVSFVRDVTVLEGSKGSVFFRDIALAPDMTLDGYRHSISTLIQDLLIEERDLTIKNTTLHSYSIEALNKNILFENVEFIDSVEVLGNEELTIRGGLTLFGSYIDLIDCIFDLGDNLIIDGDTVFILRGLFLGRENTLTINGDRFFSKDSLFDVETKVTIDGDGKNAYFYDVEYLFNVRSNLDKVTYNNTTFHGDIKISSDAYFGHVELVKTEELTLNIEDATLFLGEDITIHTMRFNINGGEATGTIDGRGNTIRGQEGARVVFGQGAEFQDLKLEQGVILGVIDGGIYNELEGYHIELIEDITTLDTDLILLDNVTIDLKGFTLSDGPDGELRILGENVKIKNGILDLGDRNLFLTVEASFEDIEFIAGEVTTGLSRFTNVVFGDDVIITGNATFSNISFDTTSDHVTIDIKDGNIFEPGGDITILGEYNLQINSSDGTALIEGDGKRVRNAADTFGKLVFLNTIHTKADVRNWRFNVDVEVDEDTTFNRVTVESDYTVTVGAVRLTLAGGLTLDGADAVLNLYHGSATIDGGGNEINGSGNLTITAATSITEVTLDVTTSINSSVEFSGVTIAGGRVATIGDATLTLAGGVTVDGTLDMDNGSAIIAGGSNTIDGNGKVMITEADKIEEVTFDVDVEMNGSVTFNNVTISEGTLTIDTATLTVVNELELDHTIAAIVGGGQTIDGEGKVTITAATQVSAVTFDVDVDVGGDVMFDGVTVNNNNKVTVGEGTLTFANNNLTLDGSDAELELNHGSASIAGGNRTIDGEGKVTITAATQVSAVTFDVDVDVGGDVMFDGVTVVDNNKVTIGAATLTIGVGELTLDGANAVLELDNNAAVIDGDGNNIDGTGKVVITAADTVETVTFDVNVDIDDDVIFDGVTIDDNNIVTVRNATLNLTNNNLALSGSDAELILNHGNASITGGSQTINGTGKLTITEADKVEDVTINDEIKVIINSGVTFDNVNWNLKEDVTLGGNLDLNGGVTFYGNNKTLSGGHALTVKAAAEDGTVLIKDLTFDDTINTVEVEIGATNVTFDNVTFGTHTLTLDDEVTLKDVTVVAGTTVGGTGTAVLEGEITNEANSLVGVDAVDTTGVTSLTNALNNATAGFAAFGTAAIDITDNNVDDDLVINLDVGTDNAPTDDWANAVTSITLNSDAGDDYTITNGFTIDTNAKTITIDAGEFTVAADDYELIIEATNYEDVVSADSSLELEAGAATTMSVTQQVTATTADETLQGPPTVTIVDQYDNLVEGEEVTVAEDGGYVIDAGTTTVTTDAAGVAEFADLEIHTADTGYVLTFDVDAAGVSDVDSDAFDVTHGVAATFTTINDGDGDQAHTLTGADETIDITATVEDQHGNPVENATVNFALGGDSRGVISSGIETTDASGESTITYTGPSVADDATDTVTATVTGATSATNLQTITIPLSQADFMLETDATHTLTSSGETFDITVKVVDSWGEDVDGATVAALIDPNVANGNLDEASKDTGVDGEVTFTYTGHADPQDADDVITLSYDGDDLTVTITSPADVSDFTLETDATHTLTSSGETFDITVKVVDSWGEDFEGESVTAILTATSGGGTLSASPQDTGADGTVTFTYTGHTDAQGGDDVVTLSYDGDDLIVTITSPESW